MLKQQINIAITKLFSWLWKNQKIKTNSATVKVNIGSGFRVTGDWINLDANINAIFANAPSFIHKILYKTTGAKNWFSQDEFLFMLKNHRFVHHRIDYGLPFDNDSIDYIYTAQFIEHLFREDADFVFNEAYRCMKKGGLIRITVPDLEIAFNWYKEGRKEECLELFFVGSKLDYYSQHRYMYDFELMKNKLESVGFNNVTKCEIYKGKCPDADFLDSRPEYTLFVEAEK